MICCAKTPDVTPSAISRIDDINLPILVRFWFGELISRLSSCISFESLSSKVDTILSNESIAALAKSAFIVVSCEIHGLSDET